VLDTCVLAELRKPAGHKGVRAAVAQIAPDDLFVSALTVGEIVKGVSLLGDGRKKRDLSAWLVAFEEQFRDRILPVDHEVARVWGGVSAHMPARGTPIPVVDALIASTAISRGLHFMTRNTRHFAGTGALVIDPWSGSS
jgi:predicted nucleic acid-binding protein